MPGEGEMAGELRTIPDFMDRNARDFGTAPAFREKQFGIWQEWTWRDAKTEIEEMALGLIGLGVEIGEHVAVIGRNRPQLYMSMVAVQCTGGIPVPLYQDAVGEEIAYVLGHCAAKFVIAGDQEQVDKVEEVRERIEGLRHIVYLDGRGLRKYDHSVMSSMETLRETGRAADRAEMERRRGQQTGATTCVMLYTSGTTGRPKGVVLSHDNIVATSKASSEFDRLQQSDEVLAYLPMAWVGDFIFSIGQAMVTGFCVNCPESADTVMHDLREIGATYYFAPPARLRDAVDNVMIRMEIRDVSRRASSTARWRMPRPSGRSCSTASRSVRSTSYGIG